MALPNDNFHPSVPAANRCGHWMNLYDAGSPDCHNSLTGRIRYNRNLIIQTLNKSLLMPSVVFRNK